MTPFPNKAKTVFTNTFKHGSRESSQKLKQLSDPKNEFIKNVSGDSAIPGDYTHDR